MAQVLLMILISTCQNLHCACSDLLLSFEGLRYDLGRLRIRLSIPRIAYQHFLFKEGWSVTERQTIAR